MRSHEIAMEGQTKFYYVVYLNIARGRAMIPRFIVGLIVAVVLSAGVSLLWPKFTNRPRPDMLETVHDQVLGTEIGEQAAEALGVSDDQAVKPIDPKQVLSSASSTVVQTVTNVTQTFVTEKVTEQIVNQWQNLPEEKKVEVKQIICQ